ncbi:MAG: UDP-N-acetylmuramoyl-L-alanine--D-glutamate ligase [Candidatus Hydrogenedentes bacterium]|nr:UDP-N-acetylmuramoyl-L-alanine--D-glutamate ligase [Candidatus Hydrogenedentota bacterium]
MRGKKVVVVGLGRTAVALARLLLRDGARVFVTEMRDLPDGDPCCTELAALGVPFECGGHSGAAFQDAALVIPSPGVPPSIEPIARARAAGASVVGEMEFAHSRCRSRILAVTGTNGKTTTTELLKALLTGCGESVALAGNNDMPFSAAVQLDPAPEFLVLEVSSYQLETTDAFRPWIGVVLNVTPDHLTRHGSLDAYAGVKARLFANQSASDHAVVNADDPRVHSMAVVAPSDVWQFSLERPVERGLWLDGSIVREGDAAVAHVGDVHLPGRHNLQNALAALTATRAGAFDWDGVLAGLRGFRGVEHRIEHVVTVNGVAFYNDSKSTNIDSLKVALESFDEPVVLIAGGEGKGTDYRVLRNLIAARVKRLVTLGQDAPLLDAAFSDLVQTHRANQMDDAVDAAAAAAGPGDIVLLSPACASFDMFENFEHRGRVFKDSVNRWAAHATRSDKDKGR